ncbi:MAG: large protein [Chitinophagaceae bacterium]|nr:large protein [Chitinophagaceae bacterium]
MINTTAFPVKLLRAVLLCSMYLLLPVLSFAQDCVQVTSTKKDVSCNGGSDGEIHLTVQGTAVGNCFAGSLVSSETCGSCNINITNQGSVVVNAGQKACLAAGLTYGGTITVNNGGKLVVCGNLNNAKLTVIGTGQAHLLGNNTLLNSLVTQTLNGNVPLIRNHGTLQIANADLFGKIENFGTFIFNGALHVMASGNVTNNKNFQIKGSLTVDGTFINLGQASVTTTAIQPGAVFDNECSLQMAGAVGVYANMTNNGVIAVNGNFQTMLDVKLTMGSGSELEAEVLTFGGEVRGAGTSPALIHAKQVGNFIWNVALRGKLKICVPTNPSGIPVDPTVSFTCDFLPLSGGQINTSTCNVTWNNGAQGKDLTGLKAGTYHWTATCGSSCTKGGDIVITAPSALTVAATSTLSNISSCTGAANAVASGGTSAYSYQWTKQGDVSFQSSNASVTALCPGNYTVTATDAKNCKATANVLVNTQTCILAATSSKVDGCSGAGSISVSITTGTAPYTMQLDNLAPVTLAGTETTKVFSALSVGTHTVLVKDAWGCTVTRSEVFTGNGASLVVSMNSTNSTKSVCDSDTAPCDGTVSAIVSGGIAPYTFSWSGTGELSSAVTNTITGMCSGTYTVVVKDSKLCAATGSANVSNAPAECSKVKVTKKNVSCAGGHDGEIHLNICSATTSGTCFNGALTSIENCTACIRNLQGNDNATINAGERVCIKAGDTYTGNLIIKSGGKLVSCGTANLQSLTMETGSEAHLLGTGNIPSLTMAPNALIKNHGTLALTSVRIDGKIENYGQLTFAGAVHIIASGSLTNNHQLEIAGSFTVDGTFINKGTTRSPGNLSNATLAIQPTATFENYCTLNMWGAVAVYHDIINNGSIEVNGNFETLQGGAGLPGSKIMMGSGSSLKANVLTFSGVVTGTGTTPGIVRATELANFLSGASLQGKLVVCVPTAPSGIPVGTGVQFSCDPALLTITQNGSATDCTVKWAHDAAATGADLTQLAAGTYTYTVTCGSNCTKTGSVTLTQPSALQVTVTTIANADCVGKCNGEIRAEVQGGIPAYDFRWNTGNVTPDVYPACAGNYEVTVKDGNGCELKATGTVQAQASTGICCTSVITVTPEEVTSPGCVAQPGGLVADGKIKVKVTGASGHLIYVWKKNGLVVPGIEEEELTHLSAGNYHLDVFDATLCYGSLDINLQSKGTACGCNIAVVPQLISKASCPQKCDGKAKVVVTGTSVSFQVEWFDAHNILRGEGETLEGLCSGAYRIVVTETQAPFCSMETNYVLEAETAEGCCPTNLSAAIIAKQDASNAEAQDGSFEVSVSQGTADYLYRWDNIPLGITSGEKQSALSDETIDHLAPGYYRVEVTELASGNAKGCRASTGLWIGGNQINACRLEVSVNEIVRPGCRDCADGKVSLLLSNASGALRYEWRGEGSMTIISALKDIVGIAAGNYTVTVTEINNPTCTVTIPVEIPDGSGCCTQCSIDQVVTDAKCPNDKGGAIRVIVHGGGGPFTYNWLAPLSSTAQEVSGLAPGFYTVIVKGLTHCNQVTKTFEVKAVSSCCDNSGQPTIETVKGTCGIAGTRLIAHPDDALGYLWSTGERTHEITIHTAGTYTLKIYSSSSCNQSTSVTIAPDPVNNNPIITSSAAYICPGGNITLNAMSGDSYLWSTGATSRSISVSTSGIYQVDIFTNNKHCITKGKIVVNQADTNPKITGTVFEVCPKTFAVPLTSTSPSYNQWYKDNVLISTERFITVDQPGTYKLVVTYPSCNAQTHEVTLTERCEKSCDPPHLISVDLPPQSCADYLINHAVQNAVTEFNLYVESQKINFQRAYVEHFMTDLTENFTMTTAGDITHHYTLYYYDKAGNLVRTVPPEGVVLLTPDQVKKVQQDRASGSPDRNVFTEHTLTTTYAFNSLNNPIGQNIPDQQALQKVETSDVFSPPGVVWDGGALSSNGHGIVFGRNGEDGVIYYTSNAGKDGASSWTQASGITVNLNDVQQLDNTTSIAAGDQGTLLTSKNGGSSWEIIEVPTTENLRFVYFESLQKGHVISVSGVVWSTSDSGIHWDSSADLSFKPGTLQDVTFVNINKGYAVFDVNGSGAVYTTTDQGVNWSKKRIVSFRNFNDIAVASNGNAYTVGEDGLLIENNGTNFKLIATGNTEDFQEVVANGNQVLIRGTQSTYRYDPSGTLTLAASGFTKIGVTADPSNDNVFGITASGYVFGTETSLGGALNSFASSAGHVQGADFKTAANFIYWDDQQGLYLNGQTTDKWPNASTVASAHFGTSNQVLVVDSNGDKWWTSDISVANVAWSAPENIGLLVDLYFTDLNHGTVLTTTQAYRTVDGGQTWSSVVPQPTFGFVNALAGNGASEKGFGRNGPIEKDLLSLTGSSWNNLGYDLNTPVLRSVRALGNTAYAVGDDGVVLSWAADEIWRDNRIQNDAAVVAKRNWVAVAIDANNSNGYMTDASGNTGQGVTNNWNMSTALTPLVSVTAIGGLNNKLVVVTDGKLQSATPSGGTVSWNDNHILGSLTALDITASGMAMSVGVFGNNWHNTSFGSSDTWTYGSMLSTFEIEDAYMVNGDIGYAVGKKGTIIKTITGGKSWTVQHSFLTDDLTDVHFSDVNTGVALAGNKLVYTTDGGAHWTLVNVSATMQAVFVLSPSNAYAVGTNGNIIKASGSLANWASMTSPVTRTLNSVHFPDETIGFAAGASGTILRFKVATGTWEKLTDGTNDWVKSKTGTTRDLNTVFFRDRKNGYVSGENGVVLKTINGGDTWDNFESFGNGNDLVDLSFGDGTDGLVIGSSGVKAVSDGKDRFTTVFIYDRLGRLILSQNAKQFNKTPVAYSYIVYDPLNRMIESGEVANATSTTALYDPGEPLINDDKLAAWLKAGLKTEVGKTHYDVLEPIVIPGFTQNELTLRNRVSYVTHADEWYDEAINPTAYQSATHFDYDIHGNVKTLIQDFPELKKLGQQFKRIDYEYDLISGKVNQIAYQKGEVDQFFHRYNYDADNRITSVETSNDEVIWERDGAYQYYQHGPMARTEIGDVKVQGMDYAYTIEGHLKGVNSNTLKASRDIGKDGLSSASNPHALFAPDEVGYTLGYYKNDYKSIAASGENFEATTDGDLQSKSKDLFNGNIANKVTAIASLMKENGNGNIVHSPFAMVYNYDQLHRLTNAQHINDPGDGALASNNWSNSTLDQSYSEALSYDANGNIQTLNRNANQGAKMDQLSYTYERIANGFDRNSNRLLKVSDNSNDLNLNDIKKGDHAYAYDELGQLTKDEQENIELITWTVDGKVQTIKRKEVANTGPDVEFQYNAQRQRVAKIVKPREAATGQLKGQDQWIITHYVLDYSGNAMGIYGHQYSKVGNQFKEQFLLTERSLYGTARLGIKLENLAVSNRTFSATLDPVNHTFVESNSLAPTVITLPNEESKQRLLGHKVYELDDYLKNTLATVSDKKSANMNGYNSIVLSANNYYSFGMIVPNTNNLNTSSGYRYGFNGMEKDDEVKGAGNSYTTEFRQYDSRLGRWLSLDPKMMEFLSFSPYNAFNNNPVVYTDPDGSEIKGDIAYFNKYIEKVDHLITSVDKLIMKTKSEIETATKKGLSTNNLNKRLASFEKKRVIFTDVIAELVRLTVSEQTYFIRTHAGVEEDMGNGWTDFESKTGNVRINIKEGKGEDLSTLSHELKHAYQFEEGKVSFAWERGVDGQSHAFLYDIQDEVEAFNRTLDLGLSLKKDKRRATAEILYRDYGYPRIIRSEQVTLDYVLKNGQTYGEWIRKGITERTKLGKKPLNAIIGWQNYISPGFDLKIKK